MLPLNCAQVPTAAREQIRRQNPARRTKLPMVYTPLIAVIPRTSGSPFWEPVHVGAEIAARSTNIKIYWNAPTREDDIQGQIALVDAVIDRKYQGLILAPDQALALITPVRRALSKG